MACYIKRVKVTVQIVAGDTDRPKAENATTATFDYPEFPSIGDLYRSAKDWTVKTMRSLSA